MSVHEDILEAVVAVIKGLDLPEVRDGSVQQCKLDDIGGISTFPCIVVSPGVDSAEPVSNTSDTCTYGVFITLARVSNGERVKGLPTMLNYRQSVRKAFRPKNGNVLPGVSAVYDSRYTAGVAISPAAWKAHVDATTIGLTFFTREPRV